MALDTALQIPIAHLSPLATNSSSKAIKAIVTLTWPYSSATGTVAFLLSEPDFRLRRTRGQVRVQFAGSSAQAVKTAGIASGDEVILSLEGVEWIQDEATVSTPGRGVEFELRFAERLLLQFKQESSDEVKHVDIDHPAQEPEVSAPIRITNIEPESVQASPTPSVHSVPRTTSPLKDNEYASPAFIKRARTSYGSMFDSDYDPFKEEDGTIPGKGRKRTRLSSSWRYSSRSPTPEVEDSPIEADKSISEIAPRNAPMMTDEGCQTTGLEEDSAAETLANFARQATNIGVTSYPEQRSLSTEESLAHLAQPLLHYSTPHGEVLEHAAAPSSPRLTPLSSDNLPEVSPMLTHKPNLVEDQDAPAELIQDIQATNSLPGPQLEARGTLSEQDVDIYTASPQRRTSTSAFTSVNPLESYGLEQPAPGQDFAPENSYGHWQGETAHLSYPASPSQIPVSGLMPDGMEEIQEEYEPVQNTQSPNYEPDEPQYPDLDSVMQGGQNSTWGTGPSTINYPRLPEYGDEIELPALRSRSAGISRSQSAAIDLTESGDEDEELADNPVDEGDYDDEDEDEDEDEEDECDDESRANDVNVRKPALTAADQYADGEDEEEEDRYAYSRNHDINPEYGDVEEPSDDEEDVQNPPLDDQDLGSEEDYSDEEEEDEEGSYDDEDEAPRVQGPPDVIEILSSDDENDIRPPQQSTGASRVGQHQTTACECESEGEDASGLEEEVNSNNVNHSLGNTVGISRQGVDNDDDQDAQFEEDSAAGEASEYDDDMEDEKGPMRAAPSRSDARRLEEEDSANEDDDRMDVEEQGDEQDALQDSATVPQRDSGLSSGRPLPPMPGPPPPKPNLFASVFGIDGAFDEPEEKPRFQTMKRIRSVRPVLVEPIAVDELVSDGKLSDGSYKAQDSGQMENKDQLPTPDATQSFGKLPIARSETSETRGQESFETAVQDQADIEIEQSHATVIETENDEPASIRSASIARVSATPAPTIKIEPVEMLKCPVQDGTASPLTHEGFEPTTVEVAHDNHASAIEIDQERDTMSIINDPAKIDIQTVENLQETQHEEFDEDLLTANYPSANQRVTRSQSPSKLNGHREQPAEEPTYTREAPRRSHRRTKSSTSTTHSESGVEAEVAPMTPIKEAVTTEAANLEQEATPTAKSRATTKAYDASIELSQETPKKGHDASIELALEVLDSPAKNTRDRTTQNIDLKFRLSRILRIELPTFTPLKNIKHAKSKLLEVFAIATSNSSEASRAKKGPRNYLITFNITDQSIAPNSVIQVQVFRPYKDALPVIEAGDGVLLRNFQGTAIKDKGFGLRSVEGEGSSWAVFKEDKEEVRGPPVEYGEKERDYIAQLKGWHVGLHKEAKTILERVNAKI